MALVLFPYHKLNPWLQLPKSTGDHAENMDRPKNVSTGKSLLSLPVRPMKSMKIFKKHVLTLIIEFATNPKVRIKRETT